MKKILVIAPHADDEVLGCGGTILKHKNEGDEIHWLLVTAMTSKLATAQQIKERKNEIDKISKFFGFKSSVKLDLPATELDQISDSTLIQLMKKTIHTILPDIVYLPYQYDAHSDHKKTYDCAMSCLKTFRAPFVKKILMYEVLSETNFCKELNQAFIPNTFINITPYFKSKLSAMKIYKSEIKKHPFPRSERSLEALSILRGSEAGFEYAEAFQLVRNKES